MNRRTLRRIATGSAAGCLALGLGLGAGCETLKAVSEGVAAVGVATGQVSEEQAQSIVRTGSALGTAFEQLSPENEYYLGRSVTATILSHYKPLENQALNLYVNELGQSLALFSKQPETFGGYHFLVLDSDEVNAFAGPGGLITLTRGMLRCCRTEDALAAVLAHEIGHIQCRHGVRAIKKSRWTGALTTVVVEAGKSLGSADLAEATKAFEGSIGDVTQTLMNSGYGRAAEREADAAAIAILRGSGYDPHALVDMLEQMKQFVQPGGLGFAKTHPAPQDRIKDILPAVGTAAPAAQPAARQQRFAATMKGI